MASEHAENTIVLASAEPDASLSYTPAYVETILQANRLLVKTGPPPGCNSYAYPVRTLDTHALLLDALQYVDHQPDVNPSPARRVCFLLPFQNDQYYALILQFERLKLDVFAEIKALLADITDETELITRLTDPGVTANLKQLYPTIRALFLGSQQHPQITADLSSIFKKAYTGELHLQFLPVTEHVIFVEHILSMLKHGKIFDHVNMNVAQIDHHGQCIHALAEDFNRLTRTNPQLHQKILTTVGQVNKLTELEGFIDRNYGTDKTDLSALDAMRHLHQNNLGQRYCAADVEFGEFLNRLPRTTLAYMSYHPFETVLGTLNTALETKISKIAAWETNLETQYQTAYEQQDQELIWSWGLKTGFNFLYSCSYAAQGRELFHCFGSLASQLMQLGGSRVVKSFIAETLGTVVEFGATVLTGSFEEGKVVGQTSKRLFQASIDFAPEFIATTAEWGVAKLTFSPEYGKKVGKKSRHLLSSKGLADISAAAGMTLGVFYTYNMLFSSPWSLVKVAGLGLLSNGLSVCLAPTATSFRPATPAKLHDAIYDSNLILSALSSLYCLNTSPLLYAFSAHVVSVLTVAIGRQIVNDHKIKLNFDQARLPLALLGLAWGRAIADDMGYYLGSSPAEFGFLTGYQQAGLYTAGLTAAALLPNKLIAFPLAAVGGVDLGILYVNRSALHLPFALTTIIGMGMVTNKLAIKLAPNHQQYPANISYWIKVANVSWGIINSHSYNDPAILIDSVSGLFGGIVAVRFGRFVLTEEEFGSTIREQQQSQLILSLAGFTVGNKFAQATRTYFLGDSLASFWAPKLYKLPEYGTDEPIPEAASTNDLFTNTTADAFMCTPRYGQ